MAFNIKNPETDRLAKELARATGESLTTAITRAIQDRLDQIIRKTASPRLIAEILRVQEYVASLPDKDARSADEIIGYDEHGLPV
jgi:antitoxin VapB